MIEIGMRLWVDGRRSGQILLFRRSTRLLAEGDQLLGW